MYNQEWEEKIKQIKTTDKICFNCEYSVWAVALGQGEFCINEKNIVDNKQFKIPNRFYSCEHFEKKYK